MYLSLDYNRCDDPGGPTMSGRTHVLLIHSYRGPLIYGLRNRIKYRRSTSPAVTVGHRDSRGRSRLALFGGNPVGPVESLNQCDAMTISAMGRANGNHNYVCITCVSRAADNWTDIVINVISLCYSSGRSGALTASVQVESQCCAMRPFP